MIADRDIDLRRGQLHSIRFMIVRYSCRYTYY